MPERNATCAEIAKKFAAEGFTVFAGRRNGEKLQPLVKAVEAAGGTIFGRSLDARKEDEITAFLNDADRHAPLESASSISAPMSIFRFSTPPSACFERSGKWRAIPVFWPGARRPG